MKLCIIGREGNFGSFLCRSFTGVELHAPYSADTFILAVPFSAYESVARSIVAAHNNKIHLVNVCSVQEDTTNMLLGILDKYEGTLTSIHPLFGPRSTPIVSERVSVLTYTSGMASNPVVQLFNQISIIERGVNPQQHDEFMARTHYQVVKIADQITRIVNDAGDVPEYMLTPSFKKMKELSNQFMDMPAGTRSSILANKYGVENERS